MARDDKTPAARTRRVRSRDDSLLLRSAESLGRVIGRLQRQLDVLARKVSRGSGAAPAAGTSPARRKPIRRTKKSTARTRVRATRPSAAKTKAARGRKAASASKGGGKKTRR